MEITPRSLLSFLGCTLIIICGLNAVRSFRTNPLNRIPGPLLASLSSYYIILIDAAGNRSRHIHRLHQRYGSVVRIGPNEVSFREPSVGKELYSQGTPYMKAPWYDAMTYPPAGIFAMRDRHEHAARRQLLRPAFSPAAVGEIEPEIAILVEKLINFAMLRKKDPINMLDMCRRLSFDIVGKLFMGQSFGALDSEDPPEFLAWMDNMFINLGIAYAFPPVYYIMRWSPLKAAQDMVTAAEKIASYGQKSFYHYIEQNGRQSKGRDLLTKILGSSNEAGTHSGGESGKKLAALSDRVTYLEVANMIFAGTDTTSTTLTYTFYELARNPEWQDRLRKEIESQISDDVVVPNYSSVIDLPILDAVINESLRLHPAVPSSLPRITPVGGRYLDGYFIPEATVVSMQCYTIHRDPVAFPDPDTWNPNRWLKIHEGSNDEEVSQRMKDLFLPFSRGTRACIGQHLASVELKVTVASLVRRTKLRAPKETTEESMEMIDHFLGVPSGGKCLLVNEGI